MALLHRTTLVPSKLELVQGWVSGRPWFVGDPVYRSELARVIQTGGTQVQQWIEIDGVLTEREPTARVVGSGSGSGSETAPALDSVELELIRVPGGDEITGLVLTGTWADSPQPTVLAIASAG